MAAYSLDLRTRVLADWDAGLKGEDVAAKYRVSRAWVHRLVQRRRETGEIGPRRQEQRIFISSVMGELKSERKAVANAIRSLGAEPVWFEEFGGREEDAEGAYLAEVETSTIYVGILGPTYGRLLPSRMSATHAEYLHAEEKGLRISVYPLDVQDRDGRQQAFLEEVWTFHTAPVVSSADLPSAISRRLARIAAEDLSPWCKLGQVVFRATSVREGGEGITIEADLRSADVAHAISGMAGERWNAFTGQFTWGDRSRPVKVSKIEMTTTASRKRTVRIELEFREGDRDRMIEMSFNGISPEELTEIALKSTLFGQRDQRLARNMGVVSEIPDPFSDIRGRRIADDPLRPLARLLLTEALV
nr:DUF4062 domain-containing protein [Acidobacteriota bacterium]